MQARNGAMIVLCLASLALAGCLGGAKQETLQEQNLEAQEITREAEQRFEELTQIIPSNYTFPGQQALEPVVLLVNDTIDAAANTAIESPRDDGGMNFQTILAAEDYSQHIPVGQAVEIHITLWWSGNPGQSVDLDIYTDLPGATSHYDPGTGQELNWNIPVKREVVNTVGVANARHLIGVQASNGRILPGQQVPYSLEIAFDYAKDVLTPYHPYAFTVPEGATGLVLRSVKVTGDEHIQARFVILDPLDNVVSFQTYDDIAIPTESVFIPVRAPGEYVFYAHSMVGGFLSLKADAPVPLRDVRVLALQEERVTDFTNPLAPGVAEHNVTVNTLLGPSTSVATPYQAGSALPGFTVEGAFPLRIEGFFEGDAVSGDAELRIIGANGIVWRAVRALRADTAQGSVGWSGDFAPFVEEYPERLAKGAYSIEVVSDGYTGSMGHRVLTYARGGA